MVATGETVMTRQRLAARVKGALLGLAVGDALGLPALFLTPVEIRRHFGSRGITGFIKSKYHLEGAVSDDTETCVTACKALVSGGDEGIDAFGLKLADELLKWHRRADLDRGPDATVMRGISRLAKSIPWRGSGDPGSKSGGALSRAVPVGLAFAGQDRLLESMAQVSSFPTHAHPVAVASSVAAATLCGYAVRGIPPSRWLRRLRTQLGSMPFDVLRTLRLAIQGKRRSPLRLLPELGEGWTAEEILGRAVYSVLHHPDDLKSALLLSANSTGDTPAIAALTGALGGALHGVSGLPRGLLRKLRPAAELRELADKITRLAARSLGLA